MTNARTAALVSRRRLLALGAAGLALPLLAGCSTAAAGTDPYRATLSADDDLWVETIMDMMRLDDKCAQLCFGPVCTVAGEIAVKDGGEGLEKGLAQTPLGGVVIDTGNIASLGQTTVLCDNVRLLSTTSGALATAFVAMGAGGASLLARVASPGGAHTLSASELVELLDEVGVNLYLGPDLDPSAPDNKGATLEDLAQKGSTYAVQCGSSLIVDCPLGFPGAEAARLGPTDEAVRPLVAPFESAVASGAAMVGFSDFEVPDEGVPATIDPAWVAYLRENLGFEGVVLSGVLDYAADRQGVSLVDAALAFIEAGGDLLYVDDSPVTVAAALAEAVCDGRLSEERVDESVRRILEVKVSRGIQQF